MAWGRWIAFDSVRPTWIGWPLATKDVTRLVENLPGLPEEMHQRGFVDLCVLFFFH